MTTLSDTPGEGLDPRPKNCRFRMADEGKAYPKSACDACGKTVITGLGRSCSVASDTAALPSGYEGLVEALALKPVAWLVQAEDTKGNPVWSAVTRDPTRLYGPNMPIIPLAPIATPPSPQPALALIEERAREKFELWFFRDMSDDQRLALLSLFEMPVDEIGRTHGRQRVALRHVLSALAKRFKGE